MIVLGDGKRFPDEVVRKMYYLLKEKIWFAFQKDNLKSILCQAIGRGIDRETIRIQNIKEKPRIAHIPSLEMADATTKVRIRMAQQLTGLLIMK
jgi:glycerol-3-phosphate O-acyltransferase